MAALVELTSTPGRKVVFTRTKHRARALARQLSTAGVPVVEMHGDLTQGARTRNLHAFSSGRANVLVATDIAARGLHIDDVERRSMPTRRSNTSRTSTDPAVPPAVLAPAAPWSPSHRATAPADVASWAAGRNHPGRH